MHVLIRMTKDIIISYFNKGLRVNILKLLLQEGEDGLPERQSLAAVPLPVPVHGSSVLPTDHRRMSKEIRLVSTA